MHRQRISWVLVLSTQPLICSRMNSSLEKQWHSVEQLKRRAKKLQCILRHSVLQMECTQIHLPALTSQLPILLKWNHAHETTDVCPPAPADPRLQPLSSIRVGKRSRYVLKVSFHDHAFILCHTSLAPRLPLQLPPASPDPSAPQNIQDALKIIQTNHNLEKMSA